MASFQPYLSLLRLSQWYKNLVVFLALFFSGNLFQGEMFARAAFAFFSLVLLSSAGYIINDLRDLQKDRAHPEKRNRPLAAGILGKTPAIVLAGVLFLLGMAIAFFLGKTVFFSASTFVLLSLLYTFVLKEILFADILAIASLFVLRALLGAYALSVYVSPWLVLCPFFLSLFLSVGKRHAEVHLLKSKASLTRKVLAEYSADVTHSLMIISTTLLAVSYALYSFLSEHPLLLFTLPFALFTIFRFYYLITAGSFIARQPEKVVYDRQMLLGILLWLLVTVLVVYG